MKTLLFSLFLIVSCKSTGFKVGDCFTEKGGNTTITVTEVKEKTYLLKGVVTLGPMSFTTTVEKDKKELEDKLNTYLKEEKIVMCK